MRRELSTEGMRPLECSLTTLRPSLRQETGMLARGRSLEGSPQYFILKVIKHVSGRLSFNVKMDRL